ncbi:MAG: LacI family DNA-binding transcriptional regulator [Planctomycetota bacterium]
MIRNGTLDGAQGGATRPGVLRSASRAKESLVQVTLNDIAKRVGVSQQVVSKVINGGRSRGGNASAATRDRILKVAAELGYRPNAAAKAMRERSWRHIGVLVRNSPARRLIHPLAFETILGINEGLQSEGYMLSIIRIDDLEHDLAGGSRAFRENMLDGVIVIDAFTRPIEEGLEAVVPRVVWTDSNVWRPTGCIQRDECWAGETVIDAIHRLGYTRARWVTFPYRRDLVTHFSLVDRYAGAVAAASRLGIDLERIELEGPNDPQVLEPGVVFDPESVVIPCTVNVARCLSQSAAGLGLTAPYDFSMVCPDSADELSRFWPGLSRATFSRFDMGVVAARMMLEEIDSVGEQEPPSIKLRGHWHPGCTAWGPGPHDRPATPA